METKNAESKNPETEQRKRMERPPTSRPKTSTGRPTTSSRPKTAGKSEKIKNPKSSDVERPQSRRPPDPNAVASLRAAIGSRVGSRMGSRLGSRMGTPLESRLGTAAATKLRPATQHGLVAQRPLTRLGTGNRQIADKTYYTALLNTQLSSLQIEIDSLTTELNRAEKEGQNLLIYEQKAEEKANEIKILQNELADCNAIIDRQNSANIVDIRDWEYEIIEEKKQNDELNAEVENLFRERRNAEEECRQVETHIAEERRRNAQFIETLDPQLKSQLEEMKAEAQTLRESMETQQNQISELQQTKEGLEAQLAKSPLKQQSCLFFVFSNILVFLNEQIAELEEKKKILQTELNAEQSPQEQRETLIAQIRRDNEEINRMEQQAEDLNEQIAASQEELRALESEFELIAGEKSDRYRELRQKERQWDSFLSAFEESRLDAEQRLQSLQTETVRFLRQIAANSLRDELPVAVDERALSSVNEDLSVDELKQLHIRLQEEMIGLNESEQRLREDFDEIQKTPIERKQIMSPKTLENRRDEAEAERRQLEEQRFQLNAETETIESKVENLNTEISALNIRLRDTAFYPTFCELRRRGELAEEERRELKKRLDAKLAEMDYNDAKSEVSHFRRRLFVAINRFADKTTGSAVESFERYFQTFRLRDEYDRLLMESLSAF